MKFSLFSLHDSNKLLNFMVLGIDDESSTSEMRTGANVSPDGLCNLVGDTFLPPDDVGTIGRNEGEHRTFM